MENSSNNAPPPLQGGDKPNSTINVLDYGQSHPPAPERWVEPTPWVDFHMLMLAALAVASVIALLISFADRWMRNLKYWPDWIQATVGILLFLSLPSVPIAILALRGVRSKKPRFITSSGILQLLVAALAMLGLIANYAEVAQSGAGIPSGMVRAGVVVGAFAAWMACGGWAMISWARRMK